MQTDNGNQTGDDNPREATAVDRFVGARIEARRKEVGLTQAQLATAIGMSDKQLRKYTKGTNRVSAGTLLPISKTLGVSVDFFFEGLAGRDDIPKRASLVDAGSVVADETQQLASAFYRITPHRRKALRQVISAIAANYDTD